MPVSDTTPQELGLPPEPPKPVGTMPPNDGKFSLAHYAAFSALVQYASRSYGWQFDEAMKDSRCNSIAMRNDPIIMSALRDRQTPTCQLEFQLEPEDKRDPSQVDCSANLTRILKSTPRLQQLKRTLLEALFYGRYGAQLAYGWQMHQSNLELRLRNWLPVNGDKLVFKWDGTPGILVSTAAYHGEVEPTGRGMAHFLTPDEQECFVAHEFEPEDADFYEGQQAGAIHGVGFRGRLYWYWWLRNNLTQILMDFLQKVGTGITIFYFEAGNDASKDEVRTAAEEQIGNNVYLFPRNRDGQSAYAGPGIQRVEVSMQGADMFLTLFNLLNGILRSYIMGEVLTTDTAATGLGSGVAEAHESTAERRTKYDAVDLDHPMQHIVEVLNRWNFPGNPCPRHKHIVDKPNVVEFMQAADFFYNLGGTLDEDDAREKLGLPIPEEGHSILSKVAPMQPSAVGALPQGVPATATEIPAQGDQGQQPVQGQPVEQAAPGQGQADSGGDITPIPVQ